MKYKDILGIVFPLILIIPLLLFHNGCVDGDDFDSSMCPDESDFEFGIVPGEYIDYMKLEEAYGCLLARYGTPDELERYGTEPVTFHYYYADLGLSGFIEGAYGRREIDSYDRIILVFAKSPFSGVTEGGNGLSSSFDEVESEFGECEEMVDYESSVTCHYRSLGITFEFVDDEVVDIWVY